MEINTIVFCWCDGTGIGHPMNVKEGRRFRCSKCKNEISIQNVDKDRNPLRLKEE